jgi:DNA-binding NarL/FixJ family response regulator
MCAMRRRVTTLLIARPGALRDSLKALLMALPQIAAVKVADNAASALSMVETYHPALTVLDSNLSGGQGWRLLKQIKRRWPYIQCVVLVDTVQHLRHAEAMGATKAVVKGYPAAKLSVTLERMLC